MISIDLNKKTGKSFSLIHGSFHEIFKAKQDEGSIKHYLNHYFKIFRTAMLADTLYEAGRKEIPKEDEGQNEFLALLFESFIFYVRIVYDLSTDILQEYSGETIKKSYNDLTLKISKKQVKDIDNKLSDDFIIRYLDKFKDLRNIRNSIKRNSLVSVYVKDKTFFVHVKYYDTETKSYRILDEELSNVVILHSALLSILASRLKDVVFKNKEK